MAKTLDDLRNADVFDSRDVIERIEELESDLEDFTDDTSCLAPEDYADTTEELATLKAFADEASGYAADWPYGAGFIRDSYFETYAQELAEDIGAIPRDAAWPAYCIDWERAARDLQMDYSSVELDGVTFWTHS